MQGHRDQNEQNCRKTNDGVKLCFEDQGKAAFGHLLMGQLKELSFRRVKIESKNTKTTVYIKRQFRIWSKLTGVLKQDNWIYMHFLCEQASALG